MPQLARIAIHSGDSLYLRCPYQAKVMKMLEMVSKRMVCMGLLWDMGKQQRGKKCLPGD
jgi:hypothetical protein